MRGKRRTYGNEFDADQLGDEEKIAIARDTKEEGDRVADITNDELDGQWWVIDVQVMAPPG